MINLRLYEDINIDYYKEKYRDKNVGFHAGRLGKAESLGNQLGSTRDTGHFGTGVYFVGRIEKINIGNYKDRPVHVVDFSGYNLLRPRSRYDAEDLHNSLKYINTYHRDASIDINIFETKREIKDMTWGEPEEMIDSAKVICSKLEWEPGVLESKFERETGHTFEEVISKKEWGSKENNFFYYLKQDLLKELDDIKKAKDRQWKALFELKWIVNKDEESILKIINKIWDDILKNPDFYSDSASTRFIKYFGYEGVDTRHIPEFDNTAYGSVIYQLREDTILE